MELKPETSGNFAKDLAEKQARFLLNTIERQTGYVVGLSYYLRDIFFNPAHLEEISQAIGNPLMNYSPANSISIYELETYAPKWSALVENEPPKIKAALLNMLTERYGYNPRHFPKISALLCYENPEVEEAYRQIYGKSLAGLETVEPPGQGNHKVETSLSPILEMVKDELELVSLKRGEILFREGEEGDAMYIIISGRLRPAVRLEDGGERFLSDKGRGEIMGEMALLSGEKRSATLYAIRDTLLMRLTKAGLTRLIEQYPQIATRFTQVAFERLRLEINKTNVPSPPNTIAVVPTSKEVPLTRFVARLAEALSRHGQVLHLTGERLNSYFRDLYPAKDATEMLENGDEAETVVAWLNEQDARFGFVLYETDPAYTAWTRRCLRQADRVLLVGTENSGPELGEIEHQLARPDNRWLNNQQSLAIIHSGSEISPSGTDRWLQRRSVKRHYHTRLDSNEDMQRLARGLSGRTIGLVLGGGGARGYTHLGVIKALREAGVPIDIVGGTSSGSLAAAGLAMGQDFEVMRTMSKELLATFTDYTLPLVSLLEARKFVHALQRIFGEQKVEDLWLDFYCVASNLTRAQMKIYRQGTLWKALRASCSIPGVFPPVLDHGELMVDGAILNNVPSDIMQELCEGGRIIVDDIAEESVKPIEYNFSDHVSGWQLLQSRFLPWRKNRYKAPGIIGIINRSITLSSSYLRLVNKDRADLYLTPPVESFGVTETNKDDLMVEIGYRYAQEKIQEWLASSPLKL